MSQASSKSHEEFNRLDLALSETAGTLIFAYEALQEFRDASIPGAGVDNFLGLVERNIPSLHVLNTYGGRAEHSDAAVTGATKDFAELTTNKQKQNKQIQISKQNILLLLLLLLPALLPLLLSSPILSLLPLLLILLPPPPIQQE